MPRTEILPGVFINKMPAEKFKRCRISINFIMPSNKDTATAYALLPYLLERGYEDCPDMTALSIKLASLYGASLSAESSVQGANRVVSISVGGIKDSYAPTDCNLSGEYTKLLLGVAFRPCLEQGEFPLQALEIESGKLYDLLSSEQNNKRSYCVRQARRRYYGNSANGVESNGYLEEVKGVTTKRLTELYLDMVKYAHIEIIAQGADGEAVQNETVSFLADKSREPRAFTLPFCEEEKEFKAYTEKMQTAQGKICKIYNVGTKLSPIDSVKMRLSVAVFGSLPTSRLFTNVREKQSLCYYCVAVYGTVTYTVAVDSGVEHDKAQHTLNAIDAELAKLTEDLVSEAELNDAKRQFINQLNSASDSLAATELIAFAGVVKNDFTTIDETKEIIKSTTAEDVRRLLSLLKPAVSYTLADRE